MPRALALAGVVAISFSAILVRAADVSAGTSAFFRVAYAVPALVALTLWLGPRDARPARDRMFALAAGVFFALDLNMWHRAIAYVGAGLATVIGNLQVVLVALVAWAVHRERPTATAALALPAALLGLALTTGLGRDDAYGSAPVLGAVFGVLTAVAYTGYLLLLRRGASGRGSVAGPLMDATIGAAVTALALGLLFDPAFSLAVSWPAHGWLALLALGAHTLGWLLISHALPRLPALETSVILLVQPLLTLVWGMLIFDEDPSPVQWAGAALVLGSVALVSWRGAARTSSAEAA